MGFFQSIFQNTHKDTKVTTEPAAKHGPAELPPPQPPCKGRRPGNSSDAPSTISVRSTDTPRLEFHDDGTHTHHLIMPAPSRFASSLNDLNDRLCGIFHREKKENSQALQEERKAIDDALRELKRDPTDATLEQKWGTCQEVVGRGAFGVVRIVHKTTDPFQSDEDEPLYAVKEFRRKNTEAIADYVNRLTYEFRLSEALEHKNIIRTFDFLPLSDTSPVYCQVMEYVGGGELFRLISDSNGGLHRTETNCFFKQLLLGVDYMHKMGIAHRDLKPENLLLSSDGCLKISDFGSAVCFLDSDNEYYPSTGLAGSEPYMAPEEFAKREYDPRKVDIWSCGIIYMMMGTGRWLWDVAREGEDTDYDRFLKFRDIVREEREKAQHEHCRSLSVEEKNKTSQEAREMIRKRSKHAGLDLLEGVQYGAKKLVYRMLDPDPTKRIDAPGVLKNEWFGKVKACHS